MSYLTVKNVADRFQVSTRTVERLIATGQLSAVRFGPKLLRIPPAALEAYEAKICPTTASTDPSSTEGSPPAGTSSGPKRDARVVSLRARRTR